MRVLSLTDADDMCIARMLKEYKGNSAEDKKLSIRCYKMVKYKGLSIKEVAAKVNLSRTAVYRRVKKVDSFVKAEIEKLNN